MTDLWLQGMFIEDVLGQQMRAELRQHGMVSCTIMIYQSLACISILISYVLHCRWRMSATGRGCCWTAPLSPLIDLASGTRDLEMVAVEQCRRKLRTAGKLACRRLISFI